MVYSYLSKENRGSVLLEKSKKRNQILALFFYNIFLILYKMGLHIASPWHAKAKEMLVGRKNIFLQIKQDKNPKTLWMHCASVGEYEQGLPIITLWKQKHPQSIVVLTFFSPSGYHAFKANDIVDEMYYLPLDSKSNAAQFVDAINPTIAIFVKYELWYYYLAALHARNIPTYMVSMYVAKNNIFQKYYGALHRTMLHFFTCIFVQDENSKTILNSIGLQQVKVTGDTRFDRMQAIAAAPFEDTVINDFCGDKKILIAGSTWPADEKLLAQWWGSGIADWQLIIVPHQIDEAHLQQIENTFAKQIIRYSNYQKNANYSVLLLDKMGMLNKIYRKATIAYIGGGFGAGIHNIIEPLSYYKPVIHGPNCARFLEATLFGKIDATKIVNNAAELADAFTFFANNKAIEKTIAEKIAENLGAAEKVVREIQANLLL